MGRRREQRIAQGLMVWVAGRDHRGNPFRQTARIVDISRLGARLAEIRCLRAPGELLELRSRGRKARFRVVWIDDYTGEAGIRCMEPAKNLWRVNFPPAQPDKRETAKAAAAGGLEAVGGWISGAAARASAPRVTGYSPSTTPIREERNAQPAKPSPMPERRERQHSRHRCVGGAELRKDTYSNQGERIWGRLTQISLGGCFVAAMHPFAPHTKVSLLLGVKDLQLRAKGVVCRSYPGLGMGVRFTEIDDQNQRGLEELTKSLGKGGKYDQFAS